MEYKVISHCNVTILMHQPPTASQAAAIVQRALSVCGYDPWKDMDIDLFFGTEGSLLLARPANW